MKNIKAASFEVPKACWQLRNFIKRRTMHACTIRKKAAMDRHNGNYYRPVQLVVTTQEAAGDER
jgi:hypothetical protein